MTRHQQLAAHSKSGEVDLDRLLHARDDEEIDRLMRCLNRWSEDLIALAEAHDPAALHFRIVRPSPEEVVRIGQWYPKLRGDQRGMCNYVEAVLGRLNRYLARTGPVPPKGKGGNRRTFDTEAIAAKARDIWKSNGGENKIAAASEAMARHPDLATGRGDPENIAKRIARQI